MKILVSNDDGYRAEGIVRLYECLRELAAVTVVAPDRNRSGASNSLTLDMPLRVSEAQPGVHYVNGTPTDCVHLAVSGLFDFEFDMVVSGINDGPNLGDDVLYSGTVAAAIEGRFLGLPTIAISLCIQLSAQATPEAPGAVTCNFATAARVAKHLVARLLESPLERGFTLNVNVPDVPYDRLRGMQVTRLGFRHRAEPIIPIADRKGHRMYWIGPSGAGQDAGEGTDFHAIEHGYVSITPLQTDLTKHSSLDMVRNWLKPLA
ncbi:MAG: 5'/3'-nucleotidase SurE [Steroidobacteraceae bacterium]